MNDDGWIKLHRKFLKWEWFEIPEMVTLFIYILLHASHHEKKWRGITIKRGQMVTTISQMQRDLKISKQTIRTCLERLKLTFEINTQTNTRGTVITICKYDTYQVIHHNSNTPTNTPSTHHQHTDFLKATPDAENKSPKNKRKKEVKKEYKEGTKSQAISPPKNYIEKIIEKFKEAYKAEYNLDYEIINQGKELAAAGKLAALYRKKYPEANTDEALAAFEVYFAQVCAIDDNFIRDALSLPFLLSQFNQINKILKHGKSKNQPRVSTEQIAAIVEKFNPPRG